MDSRLLPGSVEVPSIGQYRAADSYASQQEPLPWEFGEPSRCSHLCEESSLVLFFLDRGELAFHRTFFWKQGLGEIRSGLFRWGEAGKKRLISKYSAEMKCIRFILSPFLIPAPISRSFRAVSRIPKLSLPRTWHGSWTCSSISLKTKRMHDGTFRSQLQGKGSQKCDYPSYSSENS